MRSSRAAAALALAGALTLAACADDGKPRDPEPTWTPTSVPESPSTSAAATPTRPELPDVAQKATPAGAEAFIRHYWEVANYAQATGDVKPLRKLSAGTCVGCNGAINRVQQVFRNGGHAKGGAYSVTIDSLTEAKAKVDSFYAFEAKINARNAEQVVTEGDGTTTTVAPSESDLTMFVHWVDEAWRVDVLEVQ